jgi:hypothetical protein
MILFFNAQPVTEEIKIQKLLARAQELYGSDYFVTQNTRWLGDNLTIDSLFPSWILKEYDENPDNVLVIPIVKNYLRWLFSLDYGYGAQLEWETIRCGLYTNSVFLEAWADFYFNGADFSSSPLKEKLKNIRKLSIQADNNYFNIKGTPAGIKYAICTLFDFSVEDIKVSTANSGIMNINTTSSKMTELKQYQSFIEEHLVPAGISVIYGVI